MAWKNWCILPVLGIFMLSTSDTCSMRAGDLAIRLRPANRRHAAVVVCPPAKASIEHRPLVPPQPLAEDPLRQALAKRVELKYARLPLAQVARDLQAKLGVPVRLDGRSLSDMGIALDAPVSFISTRLSARAAMEFMLRQFGLRMVKQHGIVLFTTPEEAEDMLISKTYDVTDLLKHTVSTADESDPDFDFFIDLIYSCIRPTTWSVVGGPGEISDLSFCGKYFIVFPQTEDVHEQVEDLLAQLRAVRHVTTENCCDGRRTSLPAPLVPPITQSELKVRNALSLPITLHYEKLSLVDVAKHLGEMLDIPVYLDIRAIEEQGVNPNDPVTFAASSIPAKEAIAAMLRPLGLVTVRQYESLLITTLEQAEYVFMQVRVYDVSDLMCCDTSSNPREENDSWEDLISGCIKPTEWSNQGGAGSIKLYQSTGIKAIVANHSEAIHEEITALLANLRAMRHVSTDYMLELLPTPISNVETAVRQGLQKTVSVHFKDTPLDEVVAALKSQTGLPLMLDVRPEAIPADKNSPPPKETSASPNSSPEKKKPDHFFHVYAKMPITAEADNIPLESALFLILQPLRLTWTFQDGCLLITTQEEAGAMIDTRCYDVSDLPSCRDESGRGLIDFDELISTILTSISPVSWSTLAGAGEVKSFEGPGIQCLVVCQTWQNHRKLESLLAELRRLRGPAPTKADIAKLPPAPKPPAPAPTPASNSKGMF